MKKVLLASTALVVSAGVAAADVSLSGSAELGLFDDDTETQLHTDIDVTFTMSGETDAGVTFGASIDLDESDGSGTFADSDTVGASAAFADSTQGGETIFISGSFGTLTMGDTDGAFDRAMTEAIIGGAIKDNHEHAGYNGNGGLDGTYDGQIARYDYSFGDVGLSASAELDDTGAGDAVVGLGLTYGMDLGGVDLGLGLGYQSADDADAVGFSVDAGFAGGLQAILNVSTVDDGAGTETDHVGLAVGYSMDALTVAANWGEFDDGATTTDGFGVVVNYDLGGGAEVQFGYGSDDAADTWSLGVAMSF